MTRLEMLLWSLMVLALVGTASAKADPYYAGPPVQHANSLAIELSNQAAALTYEVDQVLGRCDERDEVIDELRDLAEDLDDFNKALHDASYNPRRWDRVAKRAKHVAKAVRELDEEVHDAIDHLNHGRGRQAAVVNPNLLPGGPAITLGFQRGPDGRTRLVERVTPRNSLGQLYSTPYRGPASGYTPLRVGMELEDRVHYMLSLAQELEQVARGR
ncbi:hypothetical protein [Aeoliella sp. SH292]|uniref:hypothetical protein n=1 Tax=Aeoliella sp. SH292 TaxID=3454464 RepID=UPI003F973C23